MKSENLILRRDRTHKIIAVINEKWKFFSLINEMFEIDK